MTKTAMEAAFERASGKTSADVAFEAAIALYLNNGGTIERARALIDEIAKKMSFRSDAEGGHQVCETHTMDASYSSGGDTGAGQVNCDTQVTVARDTSARKSGEDAMDHMKPSNRVHPQSSGPQAGGGHLYRDTHHRHAPKPISAGARAAALATRMQGAQSLLASYKVRDGRPIGEVRWHEINGMIGENTREAIVLRLIKHHVRPANDFVTIGEVISSKDLERLIQRAAEVQDSETRKRESSIQKVMTNAS